VTVTWSTVAVTVPGVDGAVVSAGTTVHGSMAVTTPPVMATVPVPAL
jgi:hypothetical protein